MYIRSMCWIMLQILMISKLEFIFWPGELGRMSLWCSKASNSLYYNPSLHCKHLQCRKKILDRILSHHISFFLSNRRNSIELAQDKGDISDRDSRISANSEMIISYLPSQGHSTSQPRSFSHDAIQTSTARLSSKSHGHAPGS